MEAISISQQTKLHTISNSEEQIAFFTMEVIGNTVYLAHLKIWIKRIS